MADLSYVFRRTGDWTGTGPYSEDRPFDDQIVERNRLALHFRGWMGLHQTYTDAIARARCAIARLVEPQPAPDRPIGARWRTLPLFLWIDARKAAT